jgi:hypothetical protein
VLTPRNDMTGAERAWAAHYQAGDVLHYLRGSKELGIERGSYAQVVTTNPKENLITVQKRDGEQVIYDPSRLRGISAYQEIEREFAVGDRIQFTAPNKELHVANRDLGIIEHISQDGQLAVRMDNGKAVAFDASEMRHFDHGYAVTSHSSQGLTAERVLIGLGKSMYDAGLRFDAALRGDKIEPDTDAATVQHFIDNCPPFRAQLCALLMSWYNTSLREGNTSEKFAAGRNDLFMSVYLPLCDVFVTRDADQESCLRELTKYTGVDTEILSLDTFTNEL